jgi:hypothetical protein
MGSIASTFDVEACAKAWALANRCRNRDQSTEAQPASVHAGRPHEHEAKTNLRRAGWIPDRPPRPAANLETFPPDLDCPPDHELFARTSSCSPDLELFLRTSNVLPDLTNRCIDFRLFFVYSRPGF